MNLLHLLRGRFRTTLASFTSDVEPQLELIKPAQGPRFGDYQANMAMPLAKAAGRKPPELARDLVAQLQASDALEAPEIAGPGFINLRFKADFLAAAVQKLAHDDRLGVEPAAPARTFVIDYSSPNVAKPMHVGHLRSTIIGESLARLLRFMGHTVIGDNHLGDWGTQFGMLIYGFKHFLDPAKLDADPVREMARIYVHVRNLTKAADAEEEDDEAAAARPKHAPEQIAEAERVLEACRQETAKLHAGDSENLALWQRMMPWCRADLDRIYQRLDIHFDHTHGESFYQPMLQDVVNDLRRTGIAEESQGALVVFLGENQPPALVQKRDGAFTYTTSDLATIRYRVDHMQPDAMLYVVDFRQALHFQQLFAAARRWGYDNIEFQHLQFGSVLGQDGKAIKTREGGAIELEALLEEAVTRARQKVEEISPEFSPGLKQQVAEAIGIGGVKYADLSQNRVSNYKFSWDKMLALEGNTATYMQYAYARVRSIFRKGSIDAADVRKRQPLPKLETPQERGLALSILRFPEALEAAAAEYKPHLVTAYLWDLANAFSPFYNEVPVLKADDAARPGLLLLCDLTARILQKGLHLLGIKTVEQM
jgi:arginyl-tRNA synthetase